MERRVIRREEDRFRAADGVSLFWRCWLPGEPRRVVLLVHGCAEHSGRYDAVAAWLATRDTVVHAYDLRGHGRSEGSLGRRDAMTLLADDLRAVVERLRKDYGDLPLLVLGHHLGGLLVLRGLAERALPADAGITSAAALEAGSGAFPRGGVALRWLARLAPGIGVATGVDPSWLSRDPDVARAYREDPEVRRRLPIAFTRSLAALMREGSAFAAGIRVPVLLLHGEADTICLPSGSRHCHAALRGGGNALRVYPQLRHEIFNEPSGEDVLCDALQWIEDRGL